MNYKPKLKRIPIALQKLILDPNNPRFLAHDSERIAEKDYADAGVQINTSERMAHGDHKVAQLVESIRRNGWQPVDMIFVRKIDAQHFVVLEGNRRVTALRILQKEKALPSGVDPLDVLEVQGSGDEVDAQISYLLGVRHHGSLKAWGAFAQAHNMYERYLRVGGMTDASFKWNTVTAERLAGTLGIEVKKVEERIKVYRVMKQLDEVPAVKKAGGIEGRFYSLTREVLDRPKSKLKTYIAQDDKSFLLDPESLNRMDNLCHFSVKERKGAPIVNPGEWRSLERILKDDDEKKRAEMLKRVEEEKQRPSEVYAERAAELRHPRWDQWLKEVGDLLRKVKAADIESDAEASNVALRLSKVITSLTSLTSLTSKAKPSPATKASEAPAKPSTSAKKGK